VTLLRPNRPLSNVHRRFNRIVIIVLAAIGIAVGLWQAKSCAAIRFGYVAGYAYASAVFLAIALCCVGVVFVIYWRTRWVGIGLIVAGVLSCAMFYVGIAVLWKLDRVAWRHEPPPFAIGPQVTASLVIYFQRGVSDSEVETFRSSVLADANGRYPSFVRSYLRLLPSQANDHEGIALTFSHDAQSQGIPEYVDKIRKDRRVENIYKDIAPSAIKTQPNRTPDPVTVR
jgi:hypothetical protein